MLSVITIDETEKWDEIVKSFKYHDIYYLSDYCKAFKIHGDGEPTLFYYTNKDVKAINVVMKRDISLDKNFFGKIPHNTYYDITTPYGYGGFLVEGTATKDNMEILRDVYKNYCENEGIVSEFVRFHPVLNNCEKVESIYDITKLGTTITIKLISKQQIWNDLISKNRNVIRKATKSGVEIFWGRDPKLLKEFIKLYNETMDKDNASDYYYFEAEFYNSILNDLKYNSMFFYAVYNEKIIAISIIMFANHQMHYHLSASDKEYQHIAATNLLLFEAACWGCENGYSTFHLGGGLGSKEDNLFKFKKAFNKNPSTYFSIGKRVFDYEKYEALVKLRSPRKGIDTSFFPMYRI